MSDFGCSFWSGWELKDCITHCYKSQKKCGIAGSCRLRRYASHWRRLRDQKSCIGLRFIEGVTNNFISLIVLLADCSWVGGKNREKKQVRRMKNLMHKLLSSIHPPPDSQNGLDPIRIVGVRFRRIRLRFLFPVLWKSLFPEMSRGTWSTGRNLNLSVLCLTYRVWHVWPVRLFKTWKDDRTYRHRIGRPSVFWNSAVDRTSLVKWQYMIISQDEPIIRSETDRSFGLQFWSFLTRRVVTRPFVWLKERYWGFELPVSNGLDQASINVSHVAVT
jgi:hypothetical protein